MATGNTRMKHAPNAKNKMQPMQSRNLRERAGSMPYLSLGSAAPQHPRLLGLARSEATGAAAIVAEERE